MCSLSHELGKGGMHGLQECMENTGGEPCERFASFPVVRVTRRDQRGAYQDRKNDGEKQIKWKDEER